MSNLLENVWDAVTYPLRVGTTGAMALFQTGSPVAALRAEWAEEFIRNPAMSAEMKTAVVENGAKVEAQAKAKDPTLVAAVARFMDIMDVTSTALKRTAEIATSPADKDEMQRISARFNTLAGGFWSGARPATDADKAGFDPITMGVVVLVVAGVAVMTSGAAWAVSKATEADRIRAETEQLELQIRDRQGEKLGNKRFGQGGGVPWGLIAAGGAAALGLGGGALWYLGRKR